MIRGRSGIRWKLLAVLPLVCASVLVAGGSVAADPRPSGPDVSDWQHPDAGPIDWFAVKAAGHDFALVKATEGSDYVNPHFLQDTASMRAAGVLRGAYHFPRFDQAPEPQAIHYVSTVFAQNVMGSLPPILDVERSNGMPANVIIDWMHRWLTEVKLLTGREPIVYTCPGFWKDEVANSNQFTDYPLWIADWNGGPFPELVGGWSNWVFWQQTNVASIPGIAVPVDNNVYNGDMGPLTMWANTPYYVTMGSS